ncbi:MAG: hypothetical protein IPF82_07800 [Blastocatellia bacterium]|nr:hypothetical protein [Blastocatellia bacterium]
MVITIGGRGRGRGLRGGRPSWWSGSCVPTSSPPESGFPVGGFFGFLGFFGFFGFFGLRGSLGGFCEPTSSPLSPDGGVDGTSSPPDDGGFLSPFGGFVPFGGFGVFPTPDDTSSPLELGGSYLGGFFVLGGFELPAFTSPLGPSTFGGFFVFGGFAVSLDPPPDCHSPFGAFVTGGRYFGDSVRFVVGAVFTTVGATLTGLTGFTVARCRGATCTFGAVLVFS